MLKDLKHDKPVWEALQKEQQRQEQGLEMIASENYASPAVMQAAGSILTNKYAEGYPGQRYYGGCEHVDSIEQLAINRARQLFGSEGANVQPHSGSQANMAAYLALAPAGSRLLGMDLKCGGHLTHGAKVSFSGLLYKASSYGVHPDTGLLDYDEIQKQAERHKPHILIAGFSSYPRELNFKKFRHIADSVGAKLVVDMAHFAGLVAAGVHPSPVPYADAVTTTTHKTLRGPRGGLILAPTQHIKSINSKIFPCLQGGPLEHIVAAKAVALHEALQPEFKTYIQHVIKNAKALAQALKKHDLFLVTGGTDNHLVLIDLRRSKDLEDLDGHTAQQRLDEAGITVNKNTVPGETRSPFVTSGLRLGTPALTSRAMGPEQMNDIATWVAQVLHNTSAVKRVRQQVHNLCQRFPIYE